jgi:hypothetical protein
MYTWENIILNEHKDLSYILYSVCIELTDIKKTLM